MNGGDLILKQVLISTKRNLDQVKLYLECFFVLPIIGIIISIFILLVLLVDPVVNLVRFGLGLFNVAVY